MFPANTESVLIHLSFYLRFEFDSKQVRQKLCFKKMIYEKKRIPGESHHHFCEL